ncbi:hypothetical protein D0T90_03575 [Neisseria animalis]|uniref:Uncharacterized protein n=1 Tax=Neisseria animalis TaxID=492 RepID=A0A5P3MQ40_NEIAN|nr:hypothetical protein D0T90_03575 [Neisseria animalis]ROW32840.1 hypothetical protein CGZ60_03195 [Neisseria animalis]
MRPTAYRAKRQPLVKQYEAGNIVNAGVYGWRKAVCIEQMHEKAAKICEILPNEHDLLLKSPFV